MTKSAGCLFLLPVFFGLNSAAQAQAPGALDGAALFKQQCSICHTVKANEPPRQGPTLAGVYDRKAGSLPGFHYSAGFAKADFIWDDAHLDAYLTNPQAAIPGSVMAYRQPKEPVRQAIISFLKEQR